MGLEAQNDEEAISLFLKEIEKHPKNGYAYFELAKRKTTDFFVSFYDKAEGGEENLYFKEKELTEKELAEKERQYAELVDYYNKAVQCIPVKDLEYKTNAYLERIFFYEEMRDTANQIADWSALVRLKPEEVLPYEKRGKLYLEQDKCDLAYADLKKTVTLDPSKDEANAMLSKCCNKLNKWDEAIYYANYAIKLNPDLTESYLERARTYANKKMWYEASDDIVTAYVRKNRFGNENDDFYSNLSDILDEITQDEDGTKILIEKLEFGNLQDQRGYVLFLLGAVHQTKELYDKAIEYFQEAYQKDVRASHLSRMAECYAQKGKLDSCLILLDQCKNMDYKDDDATLLRANCLNEIGLYQEAFQAYSSIVNNYINGFGYYICGCTMAKIHKDIAINNFTKAIELYPYDPNYYSQRASLYALTGKAEEARKDYMKILELREDTTVNELFLNSNSLIYAYQSLGQEEKAIEELSESLIKYDKNVAYKPYNSENYYYRAQVKAHFDKLAAIDDYSSAIALDCTNGYCYLFRGRLYKELGMEDMATRDFNKCIELGITYNSNLILCYAYQAIGQNDKAIEFLNLCLKENPKSNSLLYNAACVYSIMNQPQKAIEYLEKSLELGYDGYSMMLTDLYLDPIRDLPEYKTTVEKCKTKYLAQFEE